MIARMALSFILYFLITLLSPAHANTADLKIYIGMSPFEIDPFKKIETPLVESQIFQDLARKYFPSGLIDEIRKLRATKVVRFAGDRYLYFWMCEPANCEHNLTVIIDTKVDAVLAIVRHGIVERAEYKYFCFSSADFGLNKISQSDLIDIASNVDIRGFNGVCGEKKGGDSYRGQKVTVID